ncbi:hypothetical protein SteCoe_5269 [Stentor coeruleus]|uniref:Uncharacterized protein n=1 Tax=Stentor coeruleus TaxID=5963 RepID=A0A1R2CSS9_9CILI|nr:hypothetical protein SteCoe_5269 [Stentor coeruleus]
MYDIQRFLSTRRSIGPENHDEKKGISSYRISSVPLKKQAGFIIKAQKKVLSPTPTVKIPQLTYLFTPMNRTFNYTKPLRKADNFPKEIYKTPIIINPKVHNNMLSRHFPFLDDSQRRSKSIQETYAKEVLKTRKKDFLTTCEISLQTSGG